MTLDPMVVLSNPGLAKMFFLLEKVLRVLLLIGHVLIS